MLRLRHGPVLGVGLMVLLLAGCGGAAQPTPASSPPSTSTGPPVTLQFPSWQANQPGYQQFYTTMVDKFEAAHTNVKINFYEVTYADYIQTLTTAIAANQAPDILELPLLNYGAFAAQGDLTNLDSYLKKTDILQSYSPLQKDLKVNGNYYNVLAQAAGYVLYANKQILASHHLAIPTTVNQLLAECPQLTGGGNYCIATASTQDPNLPVVASSFVVGNGASLTSGTSFDLVAPKVVSAINQWRDVVKYAPPGLSTDQAYQAYFAGKTAFMIGGTFEQPSVSALGTPAVAANTVMEPLPNSHPAGYISSTLGIPSSISSADKALAWDFIEQIATPASQHLFAEDIESPAPRTSANAGAGIPFAAVQDAAVGGANVYPTSVKFLANYNEIATEMSSALSNLISSSASTTTVLGALQSQLNSLPSS